MRKSLAGVLALTLWLVSCASERPLVVASGDTTEQRIVGEMIAQQIQRRLGIEVERRLGFGNTDALYQAMLAGDVQIYAAYAGVLLTDILRETPSQDQTVIFARVRGEMERIAQLALLDPLGYDDRPAIVVPAAGNEATSTLSQAAARREGWRLGVSLDFQSRNGGLRQLNLYRLRTRAATRSMPEGQLFDALEQEEPPVDMIAVRSSDGHLTSNRWKVLEDDQQVFVPEQAALLVRQSLLVEQPRLRTVLEELSGKLDLQTMRRLNAEVDLNDRQPAEVAAEFLTSMRP